MPDIPSEWRAMQGPRNQGRLAVLQARARDGFGAETEKYAAEFCASAAQGLEDGAGVDRRGGECDHREPDRRGLCRRVVAEAGACVDSVAADIGQQMRFR